MHHVLDQAAAVLGHTIGIDLGTTGARAVRIDARGAVTASQTAPYPLLTPRPGWTEQEPEAWWAAAQIAIRSVVAASDAPIAGVGVTGQMHGAVFLDERDASIRPAILWNDQRTARAAQTIDEVIGRSRLAGITGNRALTGFQAPKILWLREAEPAHYARIRSILLPKDFLRLRLTQTHATDVSDASGTLLLDLRARDWSAEILRALDLPAQWFPPVAESPAISATISADGARATGLPAGIPVVSGAGDNAAAAIGSGVVRDGAGLVSLGTSGVVLVHNDHAAIDPTGALHAFCAAVPGGYHLMGVMLAAGGSLRWLRDAFGNPADTYDTLVAAASTVEPGAQGLQFLPYLSGERTPHMDPDARGAFIGLSLAHGRAHLVRAVLEGVAYGLNEGLARMRALGVEPDELIATGNGMSNATWRAIIAAVLDRPLRRLLVDEGPAFGAALLAGVCVGNFDSVAAAARVVALAPRADLPDPALVSVYRAGYEQFTRVYPALRGLRESVAVLS
jgi:xylulokinase